MYNRTGLLVICPVNIVTGGEEIDGEIDGEGEMDREKLDGGG